MSLKKIQRILISPPVTAGTSQSRQYLIKITAQLIGSLCFGIYLSQYLYYSPLCDGSNKEAIELVPTQSSGCVPCCIFNVMKLKKHFK